MELAVFDYVIIGLLGLCLALGFQRGFLLEFIAFLSWAAALFLLVFFTEPLAVYVKPYLTSAVGAVIGSAVALCLAPVVIGAFLGRILSFVLINVGVFSRFLGGILGLAKGAIIAFLIALALWMMPLKTQSAYADARAVAHMKPVLLWVEQHVLAPAVQSAEEIPERASALPDGAVAGGSEQVIGAPEEKAGEDKIESQTESANPI